MKTRTLPAIPLPEGDRWMTLEEVAEVFGVAYETARQWTLGESPKLKSYRPSRGIVTRKSDVNKLLESRGLPTLP